MKQTQALNLLKSGFSVFLTGQAGAGKTYVLNQFIKFLRDNHIPVAITASTGIAATHMNGMTIHSWAGIGIKEKLDEQDLKSLSKKDALVERLRTTKVLIIDEVSMLHARQLDLVDLVLRHFRQVDQPFGGIQVVFSGDFFQLPPIGEKNETTKEKFAFMSKAWIQLATTKIHDAPAIKVCYLSEQHRQQNKTTDDISLNQILNQIREQTINQVAIDTLLATRHNALDAQRVRLYTHNAKVHELNEQELNNIDEPSYEFDSIAMGDEKLIETLKKQVLAYETLTLKKGAKVMFIKNNPQEEVYNGTVGKVTGFASISEQGLTSEYPVVRLNNGRELVVRYESWSIDDENGEPLASFSQIPLCLAWAITIHKSQGMTLDFAEIDLSKTFEKGQGYVALSRVKSLEGLQVLGLNDKALLLDDFAQIADRRFFQLSAECEDWLNNHTHQLNEWQTEFITKCRLANPQIALKTEMTKPKIQEPESFKKTLPLIQSKKSVSEIAKERTLANSTILEHIGKLLDSHDITIDDIEYLKPNHELLEQVSHAYQTLQSEGEFEGGVKLRPIFEELRETIDYATIRMCLFFIEK